MNGNGWLQNYLNQLGLSNISQLPGLSPQDISGRVAPMFGLQSSQLPGHLFPSISQQDITGMYGKTYSPLIESSGQTYLDKMLQYQAKNAPGAYGGFAGSGQQNLFTQGAKDVYGRDMADVLTKAGGQRLQAGKGVSDTLNRWFDIGQQYSSSAV